MKLKKLYLIAALIIPKAICYAQTQPIIITNKGDKFTLEDLKVEPWFVFGGTTKATANNLNIYQSGRLALFPNKDRNNVLGGSDALNITTPNFSGIRLQTSAGNSGYNDLNYIDMVENSGYGTRLVSNTGDGTTSGVTSLPAGETDLEGFKIQMLEGTNTTTVFKINQINKNVGIGTNNPTQKLDVTGNVRVRNLADGNNTGVFNREVVADENGVLGYSSGKKLTSEEISINSNKDLSGTAENQLKDLYFIDARASITLPNSSIMSGRVQRFYIYGGEANVTFRSSANGKIFVPFNATNPYTPPTGTTYSGSAPNVQLNLSGNDYRFKIIEFVAVGENWFFNHNR